MLAIDQMKACVSQSPVSEAHRQLLNRVIQEWPQMVAVLAGERQPAANTAWLAAYLMDDSGSMATSLDNKKTPPNIATVRECFNNMVDALRTSTVSENLMPGCLRMNAGVLYPFTPLVGTQDDLKLTAQNYTANGFTPLYDRIMVALAAIVVRQAMLRNLGFTCGTASFVVLSDGIQEGNTPVFDAGTVALLMNGLTSSRHINLKAYAMGVQHPSMPGFRPVFANIGFPDSADHIFVADSRDQHAIRRMFGGVTRGVIGTATHMLAGDYGDFGQVTNHSVGETPTLPPTVPDIYQPGAPWWKALD